MDGQRLGGGERQVLHQDYLRDAALLVNPEIGVVDAAPAEAAGRALARDRVARDEKAESEFVAAVGDESEISASRQRGLERRGSDRADMVLAHERDRLGLGDPGAVEHAA